MDDPNPSPEDEQAARLAELARREKSLGRKLDELEDEAREKKPEPPPVGGMVGT